MFLTLHADTAGGIVERDNDSRWTLPPRPARPRWRSMVTALSTHRASTSPATSTSSSG